jgi:hypothetical protein
MAASSNPFAAAFDAYWKWPIIGQWWQSDQVNLPQLDSLPKIFPDARQIRLTDAGSQIRFDAPSLGPQGSTVYVCLTSPTITDFATGFTLCMHIHPDVAPHPVCCGLCTSTLGAAINVTVPTDDVKDGNVTLERLRKYAEGKGKEKEKKA